VSLDKFEAKGSEKAILGKLMDQDAGKEGTTKLKQLSSPRHNTHTKDPDKLRTTTINPRGEKIGGGHWKRGVGEGVLLSHFSKFVLEHFESSSGRNGGTREIINRKT